MARILAHRVSYLTDRLKDVEPKDNKLDWADVRQVKLIRIDRKDISESDHSQADRCANYWESLRWWADRIQIENQARPVIPEAELFLANPENAHSLKDTNLRGVTGLTKEQLEHCKAKGAIIDVAPTTFAQVSIPDPDTCYWKAYSTYDGTTLAQVNTPLLGTNRSNAASSPQSNRAQAQPTPPAQSIPTSGVAGSSPASSKRGS